ncbi:MAG: glycogen debranching protein GlgX [Pseudomonadota bacterium]
MNRAIGPGRPHLLGATVTADGVNFALFSAHAEAVELCLFDDGGAQTATLVLPERSGDIWHGEIAGLAAGQRYAYRVHGPYAPNQGHRFNARKLLIDPYARALDGPLVWNPALMGYCAGTSSHDLCADDRDSAAFVPKSMVTAPAALAEEPRPNTPWADTVIYEAHAKGLTMRHPDVQAKGTYLGLCEPPILDHLHRVGITAIEFLPVQGFIEDAYLAEAGRTNYWGYQTLTFFAPERRYAAADPAAEFREMTRRFHEAGIEVILDVVYNHSCEGDWPGPTLMFRGIDNASYYRLGPDGHSYLNDTGTGNTLNAAHPAMQRLILDSLRYWVEVMGVDGFRFDLAAVLGREGRGFDPGAGLLDALRQDPVLAGVKLIAEPWDIGPGGYQLGGFPPPFAEWNDLFRDTARRYWRGDAGETRHVSAAVAGSAAQFDHSGRKATASVNFLTAHDGFTLADVTSYTQRHNEANGEGNRDGHDPNFSDNLGVEGPTEDTAIRAARAGRRRNLLATLLLSQGTPMLLAGDEMGNSQSGNNNAYVQDNDIGWVDWSADPGFVDYVAELTGLRRDLPMLRQSRFLHGQTRADGRPDLVWRRADGAQMQAVDWDAAPDILCVEKRMAAGAPDYADTADAAYLIFNRGGPGQASLPPGNWTHVFTSAGRSVLGDDHVRLPGPCVCVLHQKG